MEPVIIEPEAMPAVEAPVETPVHAEPLPAGADAVPAAETDVNAAPPAAAEAAFTASPMPEEEARKALQTLPATPAPDTALPQPADAETVVQ